jgi:hypothetical protein
MIEKLKAKGDALSLTSSTLSLLCVAIALVFVAGCGEDAQEGSGSASTMSTAQFAKRASAICVETNKQLQTGIQRVYAQAPRGSDLNSLAAALVSRVIVPGMETEVADIRALGEPPGAGEPVEGMLSSIEKTLRGLQQKPRIVISTSKPFAAAERLGDEYGLTACHV